MSVMVTLRALERPMQIANAKTDDGLELRFLRLLFQNLRRTTNNTHHDQSCIQGIPLKVLFMLATVASHRASVSKGL